MIHQRKNRLHNECPIENVRYNIRLIINDCEPPDDNILEEVRGYLECLVQLSQWTDYELFVDSESRLVVIIWDAVPFYGLYSSFDIPAIYNPTVDVDWAHEGF